MDDIQDSLAKRKAELERKQMHLTRPPYVKDALTSWIPSVGPAAIVDGAGGGAQGRAARLVESALPATRDGLLARRKIADVWWTEAGGLAEPSGLTYEGMAWRVLSGASLDGLRDERTISLTLEAMKGIASKYSGKQYSAKELKIEDLDVHVARVEEYQLARLVESASPATRGGLLARSKIANLLLEEVHSVTGTCLPSGA
jgi:hypothetical protein